MKTIKIAVAVLCCLLLIALGAARYAETVNRTNSACMDSLDPLARAICEYREEHGQWPKTLDSFPESMKITFRGAPITYTSSPPSLTAMCPHPGIPILSRRDYRPGGTNYSAVNSHGVNLKVSFQRWQGS